MWADRVIEGLRVGKYIGLCTGPDGILFEMDRLALETAEEIFCHGVVAGIALAGHALPNSIGLKALPEGPRGVLDAPVTVKNEPLGRFTATDCQMEGFQRQGCVDALRKGIAHHFSGAQVLNDGQIEPALCGGNVGNIAHPGLIWLVERELSLQKVRCRRVTVSGVGGDFAGPASHRDDPGKPQLSVNPLAGTSKFRLEQVAETAQGGIVLVQFHPSPPKCLIPPLPRTGVVLRPAIVAAA